MVKIILLGVPLSTNHIYKSHCRFGHPSVYMTAEGKALKESYGWQAKSQFKEKPITGDVSLDVRIYRAKKIGDIDNYNKILFDSLTGIVWEDDKQINELHIKKLTDKKNPRIEIELLK